MKIAETTDDGDDVQDNEYEGDICGDDYNWSYFVFGIIVVIAHYPLKKYSNTTWMRKGGDKSTELMGRTALRR